MELASRRKILQTLVGGAIVLGFNPSTRSWVTAGSASPHNPSPALDGTLTTDPDVLASSADDFGHIIHRMPVAVLLPESVQDIANMVRFCAKHHIKIVGRGRGHTPFGQSQVEAGAPCGRPAEAPASPLGQAPSPPTSGNRSGGELCRQPTLGV